MKEHLPFADLSPEQKEQLKQTEEQINLTSGSYQRNDNDSKVILLAFEAGKN